MGVLGILTCEILELEFANLLASDTDLTRVTVLKDSRSERLIEMMELSRIPRLKKIKDFREFDPLSDNQLEILVQVLELALHNRKRTLQQGIKEAAMVFGPHVDALMLGYGLCGNALEKPEQLLADVGVPIFIPMDDDHPVDDCVGLIIGGRQRYYDEQCNVAGTFFMIPGWTYHWRRMFEQEFGNWSLDMAKRLFRDYERSLLITTPVMSEAEMKQNSQEFNKLFNLRQETRFGTLSILKETWNSAKTFLNSRAD
ncbi:MAG: DUF1638 domain-containing protein [Desulfobacterales bacterium]|jgi:hypothetical protein